MEELVKLIARMVTMIISSGFAVFYIFSIVADRNRKNVKKTIKTKMNVIIIVLIMWVVAFLLVFINDFISCINGQY
jgi:hypothetical protein